MKYKIAVCDDEQDQIEYISSVLSAWSRQNNCTCDINVFYSAEAFLFDYTEDQTYDILLLDVEMKGMTGLELARRVRRDNNRAEIIFITAHFEFVGEGYEVDALHYLVKPISEDKLMQVLDKAVQKLLIEPPSLIINCGGETLRIYESDILYVESFLHYIVIQTRDKAYKIKENLSAFEQKLSDDFYRVHRSYLVSLKHITGISRTSVSIGNTVLPLSRGKYDDIHRAFIEHN